MANLKRRHVFRRWAPDIGENRELEDGPALWLDIATGLTAQQLNDARTRFAESQGATAGLDSEQAIKDALRAGFVEAFGAYVRVVDGPHLVDGIEMKDLNDYVSIIQGQRDYGQLALKDLVAALDRFNSFKGPDELFSPRRSGGLASTGAQSVVKDMPKTGAP